LAPSIATMFSLPCKLCIMHFDTQSILVLLICPIKGNKGRVCLCSGAAVPEHMINRTSQRLQEIISRGGNPLDR
jgi:hypothetical protein